MIIVDVERPRSPRVFMKWDASGAIDDLNQVKIGMTNDTVFGYLADGKNGLRVGRRSGSNAISIPVKDQPQIKIFIFHSF